MTGRGSRTRRLPLVSGAVGVLGVAALPDEVADGLDDRGVVEVYVVSGGALGVGGGGDGLPVGGQERLVFRLRREASTRTGSSGPVSGSAGIALTSIFSRPAATGQGYAGS